MTSKKSTKKQPKERTPKMTQEEQSRKFVETARELGADESGKSFKKVIGFIMPAAAPPDPSDQK